LFQGKFLQFSSPKIRLYSKAYDECMNVNCKFSQLPSYLHFKNMFLEQTGIYSSWAHAKYILKKFENLIFEIQILAHWNSLWVVVYSIHQVFWVPYYIIPNTYADSLILVQKEPYERDYICNYTYMYVLRNIYIQYS